MKGVVVPAVKRVPNPRSVPQRPNTEEIDPKIKNNQVEKSETFPKKNGSQCTAEMGSLLPILEKVDLL